MEEIPSTSLYALSPKLPSSCPSGIYIVCSSIFCHNTIFLSNISLIDLGDNVCRTQNGRKCVFPFEYKKKTYNGCTGDHSESGKFWCLEEGFMKWGYCKANCPSHVAAGVANPTPAPPSKI